MIPELVAPVMIRDVESGMGLRDGGHCGCVKLDLVLGLVPQTAVPGMAFSVVAGASRETGEAANSSLIRPGPLFIVTSRWSHRDARLLAPPDSPISGFVNRPVAPLGSRSDGAIFSG